jgi:hypothetical protein
MTRYSFRRRWPFFILLAAAFVLAMTYLVMALWNALLPELFHLPVITLGQAFGLLVLSKILFGGFRGGPGPRWRGRMDQRWMNMTPEERERFKQEWSDRCGRRFGSSPSGASGGASEPGGTTASS